MPGKQAVLVVGTTSDYIEWIRNACPGRACFLTAPSVRESATEPAPSAEEEIICDLSDHSKARFRLMKHLKKWNTRLSGIACFDCESLELAATLASDYSLPYPSLATIRNCRDKYVSKVLWKKNGVPCAEVRLVGTREEAIGFFDDAGGSCVLKPLSGSGSELVYRCESKEACEKAYHAILKGLNRRRGSLLYNRTATGMHKVVAEGLLDGIEYSCDFIIDRDHVDIIRLTRKLPMSNGPFGTTRAYVLEIGLPEGIEPGVMEDTFQRAAQSLGLFKALCMVDFIIKDGAIMLLELTPRPGGDCIPFLLKKTMGLDILKLTLDFAEEHRNSSGFEHNSGMNHVGLRIHANNGGVLNGIATRRLVNDNRILEINLQRKPGHYISMPPDDYDSWMLGNVIFRAEDGRDIEKQCDEVLGKLDVEIGQSRLMPSMRAL